MEGRRPIQIQVHPRGHYSCLAVLCADGTIWEYVPKKGDEEAGWRQILPPIPNETEEND